MTRKVVENVGLGQGKERDKRLRAMEKLAKGNPNFRPASEVLTLVKAVPTCFPHYDYATGVGGHAIERVVTIQGPSGDGKTAFSLGLGKSFLQRDHFFKLVDAEYTTPLDWVQKMLREQATHPGFSACRPESYDETREEVRGFVKAIAAERKAGNLDPKTTAIIVVDSLNKLVPKDFWDRINAKNKQKGGGADGYSGAFGMIKAALNAAWLLELVPLLYHTMTALAFIVREAQDTNASASDRKFGKDYRATGGTAVIYDSSLGIRIERAGMVYEKERGDDDRGPPTVFGERHRFTINKTKVAGKQVKSPQGYFYSSNGLWVPEGLDTARDLVELGIELGAVDVKGSWLALCGKRFQGKHNAVKKVTEDAGLLAALDAAVRAKFPKQESEVVQ